MSEITPDRLGFSSAMERVRETFGIDVDFHVPMAPIWDDDERLDPLTGIPLDPWAIPVSSGAVDVRLRASLVSRPLTGVKDEMTNSPLGQIASDSFALILASGASASIGTADYCTMMNDTRYMVTELRYDSVLGCHERLIAYLRRA